MSITIDVRDNFAAVQRDLVALQAGIRDRAIASAINRTTDQARTRMIREITREFEMKSGDVRAALKITRARGAGGVLVASLAAFQRPNGRGFNVIRFAEKKVTLAEAKRRAKAGTLNQLGFKIKRGGGTKRIKGAFIGNKGRTVFVRVGKPRLPIKGVTTIDVAQMFNTRRINGAVVAFVRAKFPELLARELAFAVSRQR